MMYGENKYTDATPLFDVHTYRGNTLSLDLCLTYVEEKYTDATPLFDVRILTYSYLASKREG